MSTRGLRRAPVRRSALPARAVSKRWSEVASRAARSQAGQPRGFVECAPADTGGGSRGKLLRGRPSTVRAPRPNPWAAAGPGQFRLGSRAGGLGTFPSGTPPWSSLVVQPLDESERTILASFLAGLNCSTRSDPGACREDRAAGSIPGAPGESRAARGPLDEGGPAHRFGGHPPVKPGHPESGPGRGSGELPLTPRLTSWSGCPIPPAGARGSFSPEGDRRQGRRSLPSTVRRWRTPQPTLRRGPPSAKESRPTEERRLKGRSHQGACPVERLGGLRRPIPTRGRNHRSWGLSRWPEPRAIIRKSPGPPVRALHPTRSGSSGVS